MPSLTLPETTRTLFEYSVRTQEITVVEPTEL